MKTKEEIAQAVYEFLERNAQDDEHGHKIRELDSCLNCVFRIIMNNLDDGRELQKQFNEDKLPLNGLEAEGFVRACLKIIHDIRNEDDFTLKMADKYGLTESLDTTEAE